MAAIAHIWIDFPCSIMVCTRILGHPLGLNSTSLRRSMALAGLGRTFLGFRLGTFCLSCLLVG
ncbi:MAG: hypothetical protein WAN93_05410 [Solirubrobacteraceae bacterium]